MDVLVDHVFKQLRRASQEFHQVPDLSSASSMAGSIPGLNIMPMLSLTRFLVSLTLNF